MNSANQEKIYTWMESRSFRELSSDEQALVLEEMDEATYTDMFETIRVLDGKSEESAARGKEAVWEEIDRQFRPIRRFRPFRLSRDFRPSDLSNESEKSNSSNKSNKSIPTPSIPLSWAAAIILLLLLGLSWSLFRPQQSIITEVPVIEKDTVLVEVQVTKEVPFFDTVYLEAKGATPSTSVNKQVPAMNVAPSLEPELHIQSPSESEDPVNRSKRNSLQYDTLVEKIGFVSL